MEREERPFNPTRDPRPPAAVPHRTRGTNSVTQLCLQTAFSMTRVMTRVRLITNPPTRDATVPRTDKPPLVPGGTGLNVVIKMGGDFDNMPNSDAKVSPKQQEKWLNFVCQTLVETCEPWAHPRDTRTKALLHPDVTCGDTGHHSVETYGRPGTTSRLGNNWDANEFGTKEADQRRVAMRAEKELQRTCDALLYPASWCPSSNCALRLLPTLVAREPTR